MATIGTLTVNVAADTSRLSAGLQTARREVSLFTTSLGSLTGVLKTLGIALGGAAAVSFLRRTADDMDRLGKAAQRLDLPTEALSGLAHAASLSDVSLDGLVSGLTQLERRLGGGDKATVEWLEKLGLDLLTLRSERADQVLLDIADALNRLPSAAERTAAAMSLFGRSGVALLPLLAGGREEIEKLVDEARRAGVTFGDEAARSAEAFNDSITRLTSSIKGLAQALVGFLAPPLTDTIDALRRFLAVERDIFSVDSGRAPESQVQRWQHLVDTMNGRRFAEFQRELGMAGGGEMGTAFALGTLGVSSDDMSGFEIRMRDQAVREAVRRRGEREAEAAGRQQQAAEDRFWADYQRMRGDVAGLGDPLEIDPAMLARTQMLVESFGNALTAQRLPPLAGPGGAAPASGFRALEAGSAEAFRQARRSQEQDKGLDVARQHLAEAKQQTEELRRIDDAVRTTKQLEVVNIA